MDAPKLLLLTPQQFRFLNEADPDGYYCRDERDQLFRIVKKLENFRKDCSRAELELFKRHQRCAWGLRLEKGQVSKSNIKFEGNLQLDGTLEADMHLTGGLVVTQTGVLSGTVSAASIVCRGVIQGDVSAQGTVHLCARGKIEGRVEAACLQIEDGAHFLGHCRLEPENNPQNTRSPWTNVLKMFGVK